MGGFLLYIQAQNLRDPSTDRRETLLHDRK